MKDEKLVNYFFESKKVNNKKKHEFALWCANEVRHLMKDPRSIAALDAKRKWLDGKISNRDLEKARHKASLVVLDKNCDAARVAANAASRNVNRAANVAFIVRTMVWCDRKKNVKKQIQWIENEIY